LFFGWVIKYPDFVYGEFRLISSSPSITIPLPKEIQINQILKYDNEFVGKGEHILIFENNANYQDILNVENILQGQTNTDTCYVRIFKQIQDQTFNLGDLQTVFAQYYEKLFEFFVIVELKKHDKRVSQLERQLNLQYNLKKNFEDYTTMGNQEKVILKKTSSLDSILFSQKLDNEMEYIAKKQIALSKAKGIIQQEIEVKRNELEIIGLENAIETEKENKRENLIALCLQLKELTNKLNAGIGTWVMKYVVVSPIEGKLHFIGKIDAKRYIGQEETVIAITPESPLFKAVVKIPFQRAGKVKTTLPVHLKLNDYPFREFGFLEGRLSLLSDVAGAEYYMATVTLDNGLITTSKTKIVAKENMGGIAEIIVNDRSLLARLFEKIVYVFKN
jgi:hypothetical protein